MAGKLKIVAVHGIGHQSAKTHLWRPQWDEDIKKRLSLTSNEDRIPDEIAFPLHDDLFAEYDLSGAAWAEAFARLSSSYVYHTVGDTVGAIGDALQDAGDWVSGWFRRKRGFGDRVSNFVKWYMGMVAQWVAHEDLRRDLRKHLHEAIRDHGGCDLLIGHSLGSLVCYDYLLDPKYAKKHAKMSFLTLGSQIGNPGVRSVFGGRLVMPSVRQWFHLFNPNDRILTAQVSIADRRYRQLVTTFDPAELNASHPGEGDWTNHNALGYFADPEAKFAWEAVSAPATRKFATEGGQASMPAAMSAGFSIRGRGSEDEDKPTKRALIVGIDEYASPGNDLAGCVNDAFLMSAVLQESGFEADEIRLVLNHRATASGIRERLEWLLDDVRPGDVRVFHYSGHGAQIPTYGVGDVVDGLDECLVPHDFDGTRARAVVDDWFYELYTQLPYEARFLAIFDCCHSGGITRDGNRVRGIDLPDDIRHRAMRWDEESDLWVSRPLDTDSLRGAQRGGELSVGSLGRGKAVWGSDYDARRKHFGHNGPYMPVVLKACRESELAEEYRHGQQSFGAFTYAIVRTLRKARRERQALSFEELLAETTTVLHEKLDASQTPGLEGPAEVTTAPVPVSLSPAGSRKPKKKAAKKRTRKARAKKSPKR